jgi:hypothetical protein
MVLILIMLAMQTILLGGEISKSPYVIKPDIPDTIKGIQIQFEVKQVKIFNQGREVEIYCLCADITNMNDRSQSILVRYRCKGVPKKRKIEIGGRQQRIILVDKCIMSDESSPEIEEFYSLLDLEYRQ